jgi:hypothetical protein
MRWMDAGQPTRRAVLLTCAGAAAGLVAAGCGTATMTIGAPSRPVPGLAVPHSAIRQLTALAGRIAKGNGDASPAWVSAVTTTRRKALTSATPGDLVPGDAHTVVYLVTMKGHFTDNGASRPPGAKAPTGAYLSVVVDAKTFDPTDFGIGPHPPPVAPASLGPTTYLKI